jgi:hypothetical protein
MISTHAPCVRASSYARKYVARSRYTDAPEEPSSERTPAFRHLHFSGVRGTAEQAVLLEGLPESAIEDVGFSDVDLRCKTGMSLRHARDIRCRDVRIDTTEGPALLADSVADLDLFAFESRSVHPNTATVQLERVNSAFVHGCSAASGVSAFVRVGAGSDGIVVRGNSLGEAERAVVLESGLPRAVVDSDEKIHRG